MIKVGTLVSNECILLAHACDVCFFLYHKLQQFVKENNVACCGFSTNASKPNVSVLRWAVYLLTPERQNKSLHVKQDLDVVLNICLKGPVRKI